MLVNSIQKVVRAEKNYSCDACSYFILDTAPSHFKDLTFSERKAIVRAKRNNWEIKKGQPLVKTHMVSDDGGSDMIWRTIPEIEMICTKYDLY